MRELSSAESDEIERRRLGLDAFVEERLPVLADFIQRLQLPNPHFVLLSAEDYLPAIDEWLATQIIGPEDRTWLLTRIGYFVGELFVQRFSGMWFLNVIPDSRFFARYVVGQFYKFSNANAMIDPFQVAAACLDEPPGRSLKRIVLEVEDELVKA